MKFKTLNSKLNCEVAEFEKATSDGTHYLSGGPQYDEYQPSAALEAEARGYTLGGGGGGSSSGSSSLALDSAEDRRQRILAATMNRLLKEEEEIEHSCGTHSSKA
jgi:hypothetical protein